MPLPRRRGDRGGEVALVTAPVSLPSPPLVRMVKVRSAPGDVRRWNAVLAETADADALIMAAAVADYRPSVAAGQKIKKTAADEMIIQLEQTTDILATATGDFIRVGFSAESENLEANAADKVRRKGLDLIVANDITEEGRRLWRGHQPGGADRPGAAGGTAASAEQVRRRAPDTGPGGRPAGGAAVTAAFLCRHLGRPAAVALWLRRRKRRGAADSHWRCSFAVAVVGD